MSRRRALAVALLVLLSTSSPVFGWFGSSEEDEEVTRPLTGYNTITVRTAYALQFLQNSTALQGAVEAQTMPLGGGEVRLYRALPGEVVLVFQDDSLAADVAESWGSGSSQVPFLRPFVYTAEAPTTLLDAWEPLSDGAQTTGQLADAVEELMGGDKVVRVVCVGEGPSGGLATLCGPWAALQYPEANVQLVEFNRAPWTGFNPQFAWAFEQLVVLHYRWPFAAPILANASGGVLAAAEAVNGLITSGVLPDAVRLPNLPQYAPPDLQDPGNKGFDEVYAAFLPDPALPEEYQLPPSDCPVMFCKTRPLLKGSCLGFDNDTLLAQLPHTVLHDDRTNADAVVAWDEATRTAYFLWKYTEEKRDWLTDASGIQVEGFVEEVENLVPGSTPAGKRDDSLTALIDDVEVHMGFYNQFKSLAIKPKTEENNITAALYALNNGQFPRRVACSGFSLGAALSELCGVWVAILWPGSDILVANQGGPIPGNDDFKLLFESTVGRAYKYVYRMDIVASAPPLAWYKRNPAGIWINGSTALLQDRPSFDFFDLSWNDHTCDTWLDPKTNETIVGYMPRLYNITRPTVPAWVFNATAADGTSGPLAAPPPPASASWRTARGALGVVASRWMLPAFAFIWLA